MTTTQPLSDEVAPEAVGSLASSSFWGLVITQFLGAFNDNLFRWLAVLIASQSALRPEVAIALGTVCLTLPYLFLSPAAGWLADRFRKRSVIIGCKIAEIVIILLGLAAILYGNVWVLAGVVLLMGSQSALFGPAKFGALPEILPTRSLSQGNGIMGMASIVAIGLGTVAGFVLFDLSKPELGTGNLARLWVPGLTMVSLAILGTLTSLLIRTPAAADPLRKVAINPLTDIQPALRLLWSDRRLMRTALAIAFFYFLASLAQQNIDTYGHKILGLGHTNTGILMGLLIAGVAVGSLLAGYWSEGKVELGIVPLGSLGIAVSSIALFVCGALFDAGEPAKTQFAFWAACGFLFLLGASAGLYDVPLEAYLQFRSDRKTRGMVLAGSFFLSYALIVLSCAVFLGLSLGLGLSPSMIFMFAGLITIPVTISIVAVIPDLAFRFLLWMISHTFYRLRVYGRDNIPEKGGALIVANHISFMDGILMCATSSRFVRFIIYTNFTEMPLLKPLGRIMRVIPIRSTDGPKELIRSLGTAKEAIKNGEVVCIFAEGGLTRTGQIQPFQRGMLRIVQGTGAPIIPAYLHGLWGSVFSWRGGKLFWKKPRQWRPPVEIHFGKPLHQPRDAAHVRQAVERLAAEAYQMNAPSKPIPPQLFIRQCKSARKRIKVKDSLNVSLTGGRLLAGALAFRRLLAREVFSPTERNVGILLPPCVGATLANAAIALDRRVAVNLNYTLSEDVLNYCVKKAGLKHVITSRKFLEKKPYELETGEFVFLEDLKTRVSGMDRLFAALGAFLTPARLLERLLKLDKVSPDEILTIVFTSGSTGEPKGVLLSHANIGTNVEAIDQLVDLRDQDTLVGVLPFFHSFGYTGTFWLPLCYNVSAVYHANPLEAKVVGRLCQENRATIFMATPTFLKMYLRRCERSEFEALDLIIVGAEKLPVDLARQFEEKFGVLPIEGYGTTELSPVAAVNIPDHRSREIYQQGTKLGTVGRPLPGVTAKVVDPETGEDLGIGKEGLLLIKGPNVMRGYLDEPEKTSEVIQNGWYVTGDFAEIDDEGFVTIKGRQSRFSKIGGEMVPHIRIEQELMTICEPPEVDTGELTLAVTAVPDEDRGERIVVLYTRLCQPVDQIVKQLARTGMPKLWLPSADSFVKVDAIPVLGTGKLDLRAIKELALQAFALPVA